MTTTPIRLKELEEKAKAATPGPWKQLGGTVAIEPYRNIVCHGAAMSRPGVNGSLSEDAAFIASANPDTVLRLIAALREATMILDEIATSADEPGLSGVHGCMAQESLNIIRAEVDFG